MAFSPDGKTLAGTVGKDIHLWDIKTGERTGTFTGHTWVSIAWYLVRMARRSPVAVAMAIFIYGTYVPESRRWHPLGIGSSVWRLVPDGRTLVSGAIDGTVHLWDANSGKYKETLEGHTDWIRSVAFSPDGKILASGGDDGTVLLWDMTRFHAKTD